jgi:hypothetical protein
LQEGRESESGTALNKDMEEFKKYFTGLTRDFGFCNVENGYIDENTGKLKIDPGDYGWAHRAITDEDYQKHLNGKVSIGLQPCDDEGTCSFGAIDVDPNNYSDFNIGKFLKVIQDKDLPVIPVKSKSGGLHIYMFTKEKVPATLVREVLQNLLFLFGLSSKTEIYPKQTKLGKNQNGEKTVGSFINLPYFKTTERRALKPDGSAIEYKDFLEVVKVNLQTKESLQKLINTKVNDELTGGPDDLKDGPPCLQVICKQIQESGTKLKDERDRFLFNYMVFAKKKYPESWDKKVLAAARDFIQYDEIWGDEKVKEKIKFWKKDTAGHTCYDLPISAYCAKGVCIKRKFGIGSNREANWPQLSNLIKITYRPEPEYFFDVELGNNDVVQVHAKNISRMDEVKQMRKLVADNTSIFPPMIKQNEFQKILDGLWATKKDMPPPIGTNPIEILKEALIEYVNGPEATTNTAFESGSVLIEEDHYYFIFQKFYEELKRGDWTQKRDRTAHLIRQHFKGDFDCKKRFPKGDNKESFPQLRVLKLPIEGLEKEETPDEKVEIEDKKEIV